MALLRTTDTGVLDLIEESGRNVQRATLLLRDLFAEYPERSDLARDLLLSDTALGLVNGFGFLLIYALAGLPIAITSSLVPVHFPCGIAKPFPMPVVRVALRSRTASTTFLASVT